jgi:hypothetical protein
MIDEEEWEHEFQLLLDRGGNIDQQLQKRTKEGLPYSLLEASVKFYAIYSYIQHATVLSFT